MEEILDIYKLPFDPMRPVVCMDEQPVQLLGNAYAPQAMSPGRPAIEDYEYTREGTASIFMFTEALAGWRRVSARPRRTMVDWAQEIRELVEVDFSDAEKIVLVMDNLNTHRIASLYEAFVPAVARSLRDRLEIHYTPKHGSWLNIAESELSVMTRQCLSRRISTLEELRNQTAVWSAARNAAQRGTDWQFTTENARIKLKHLYPHVQF